MKLMSYPALIDITKDIDIVGRKCVKELAFCKLYGTEELP